MDIDELFAKIGRLVVENDLLRRRLASVEADLQKIRVELERQVPEPTTEPADD
jgi:hypothetical protein